GVRLVSFAVHWIKAEMHEYILRNWRIVKVATTKAQRKLFFNLRSTKKRLGFASQAEIKEVANTLGVKPQEVVLMEARLNAQDLPYDGMDLQDDSQALTSYAPKHFLEDKSADPALLLENTNTAHDDTERLSDALASLNERERAIIQRRWLVEQKATLHDLADEYAISAERVRQLETNALKKLKAAMA
ncbi:MAG: rpoH, partial [Gammaproteobacteria bacterium]|nr:rpoH [Gammaproteobacteria bacterium]